MSDSSSIAIIAISAPLSPQSNIYTVLGFHSADIDGIEEEIVRCHAEGGAGRGEKRLF